MEEETQTIIREAIDRLRESAAAEKYVVRHVKPTGETVWLETALSKLPAADPHSGTQVVAITRDVTVHKHMEDELGTLANTDELTKLANRRYFNLRFEDAVSRAVRSSAPVSLLMIDADRFKLFNDSYGHAAGDDCLKKISAVLRDCVRQPEDLAARYGGEELAVILARRERGGRHCRTHPPRGGKARPAAHGKRAGRCGDSQYRGRDAASRWHGQHLQPGLVCAGGRRALPGEIGRAQPYRQCRRRGAGGVRPLQWPANTKRDSKPDRRQSGIPTLSCGAKYAFSGLGILPRFLSRRAPSATASIAFPAPASKCNFGSASRRAMTAYGAEP